MPVNRPQVYVLEDCEVEQIIISDIINQTKLSPEVHCFKKGSDLIHALRNQQNRSPDLIMLDIHLPDMKCFDILKEIEQNESLKNIPKIVLSNSDEKEDLMNCYKHDVSLFINKMKTLTEEENVIEQIRMYLLKKKN